MAKGKITNTPPAIAIKLDSITGLDTARILSGYGIPVYGIADDPGHYCVKTNSCREVFFTDTSGEGLVRTLLGLAARFKSKPVLFPCSDESVRVISANKEALREFYNFVIQDDDVLPLYMDKENFYRYAEENCFNVPSTFFPKEESDLETILKEAELPYIIKPALKSAAWVECFKDKVVKVNTREELFAVFERGSKITDRMVIQKWIKGDDSKLYSCIFYYDRNGERRVSFISRKLRQWYTENGDACLAEECRSDEVVGITHDLLANATFSGIGSVEYKLDDESGKYYIIEANVGRPVTRIALTEAAGVPLLYTMYCDPWGCRCLQTETRCTRARSGSRFTATSRPRGNITGTGNSPLRNGLNPFTALSLSPSSPFAIPCHSRPSL